MLRRELCMLPDDEEYLNNSFPNWESLATGNWVLLPDFPLPEGYEQKTAIAAIKIPGGYPTIAPDMVYFYPSIKRVDGKTIPATQCYQSIDGKEFQRWSRHYLPGTWHAEEDGIAIHVMAIKDWLEKAAPKE